MEAHQLDVTILFVGQIVAMWVVAALHTSRPTDRLGGNSRVDFEGIPGKEGVGRAAPLIARAIRSAIAVRVVA